MTPEAIVAHNSPHRLRIRVPSRKGQEDYFQKVKDALVARPDVAFVTTNPVTGSILLLHTAELAALEAFARGRGWFDIAATPPATKTALSAAETLIDRVDERLRALTHERYDLNNTLFLGLVGLGVLQAVRGQVLGPASSLLASAASILLLQRSPDAVPEQE